MQPCRVGLDLLASGLTGTPIRTGFQAGGLETSGDAVARHVDGRNETQGRFGPVPSIDLPVTIEPVKCRHVDAWQAPDRGSAR